MLRFAAQAIVPCRLRLRSLALTPSWGYKPSCGVRARHSTAGSSHRRQMCRKLCAIACVIDHEHA